MLKITIFFLVTAILYAAVGFGGGSTYSALLILAKTDYLILPSIALVCNIIVVFGGTLRFHARNLIPWRKIGPLLALSVPLAWVGGRIPISETIFILLLGLALFLAGLTMLFQQKSTEPDNSFKASGYLMPITGSSLGFISGLVGIGGGIFLAPILHLIRWEQSKVIAGVCSAFILVNSVAGLLGQTMKLQSLSHLPALFAYWPLFVAVLIGGQIGSISGSGWLNPRWVKLLTALLIFSVATRLLWRSISAL